MVNTKEPKICLAETFFCRFTPTQWLWCSLLYITGILCSSLQQGSPESTSILSAVFNFLHIPAYSGLTFLLFGTLYTYAAHHKMMVPNYRLLYLSSFIIAVIYGVLNEFVQANIPGRTFGVDDMARNALGAGLSLALIRYFLFR